MPLPGAGADVATVLNGLFGDELPERGSPLAIPLTFRTATGHELPMDRAGLERALPDTRPVRVREIDLIGHSMGGLVLRCACHYGTEDEPAVFPNAAVRLCPRINHVSLANHPVVYDEITRWWE
jgi:pimeloyl-ACP methyl ester carboxylesterase